MPCELLLLPCRHPLLWRRIPSRSPPQCCENELVNTRFLSGEAPQVEQMSFALGSTYVGLMDANFWSLLLLTNSLLMKRPTGCAQDLPLGAVS